MSGAGSSAGAGPGGGAAGGAWHSDGNPWLDRAAAHLAAGAHTDGDAYPLAHVDAEALLDLARVAAHTSGDRRNAPLVCYLVGIARGANQSLDVARLARELAELGPLE